MQILLRTLSPVSVFLRPRDEMKVTKEREIVSKGFIFADLAGEDRITFPVLARKLAVTPNAIKHWALRGVAGIKLLVDMIGPRVVTSWEAYQRFQAEIKQNHQHNPDVRESGNQSRKKKAGKS